MDPYLEAPSIWPDVHSRLLFAICDQLQPALSPRYSAIITPYVTYEAIDIAPTRYAVPDVGIIEQARASGTEAATAVLIAPLAGTAAMDIPTRYGRIEIRTVGDETLVTVIELLSPANKRPGPEHADAYERKRQEIFQSTAHLVEIDLLRGGRRPALLTPLPPLPYFIFVSRAERRPHIEIWPVALQAPVPPVPIPLRRPDPDARLDLTAALDRVYQSARYDLRIDYGQPPPPPDLPAETATWLDLQLRAAGKRSADLGDG
jgi:hypothetical protein